MQDNIFEELDALYESEEVLIEGVKENVAEFAKFVDKTYGDKYKLQNDGKCQCGAPIDPKGTNANGVYRCKYCGNQYFNNQMLVCVACGAGEIRTEQDCLCKYCGMNLTSLKAGKCPECDAVLDGNHKCKYCGSDKKNTNIKENYVMNFISAFNELDKLYEETETKTNLDDKNMNQEKEDEFTKMPPSTAKNQETSTTVESLTEADDAEIEIVDDEEPIEEAPVEEPKQLVLECGKCGALVVIDEADLVIDEESGLANIEDECKFCEETAGYKIIGSMVPYETETAEEPVEEEPVEELAEENPVEESLSETLRKESGSRECDGLASMIHDDFASKGLKDKVEVVAASGGRIEIYPIGETDLELLKKYAVEFTKKAQYTPEVVEIKHENDKAYVLLTNIARTATQTATK